MKKFDTGDDVAANPDTDTATLSDGSIAPENVVSGQFMVMRLFVIVEDR